MYCMRLLKSMPIFLSDSGYLYGWLLRVTPSLSSFMM